jgi:protein tyrosine/serine phosphatase
VFKESLCGRYLHDAFNSDAASDEQIRVVPAVDPCSLGGDRAANYSSYRARVNVEAPARSRHLPLDGCFNFRDIGGYRATNGRSVRWRRFFRSGGPLDLSASDLATIHGIGVETIVDLRTEEEVSSRGAFTEAAPDATVIYLPMTDLLPPEDQLARWNDPVFVADEYTRMLSEASPVIAEAIAVLTDPSAYPVLVHCSAGKDRTGILIAIVLGLLGVSRQDIVYDYALSRLGMQRLVAWLRVNAPDQRETVERLTPAILASAPTTMENFVDRLIGTYGSFDDYASALGVRSAPNYLKAQLLA